MCVLVDGWLATGMCLVNGVWVFSETTQLPICPWVFCSDVIPSCTDKLACTGDLHGCKYFCFSESSADMVTMLDLISGSIWTGLNRNWLGFSLGLGRSEERKKRTTAKLQHASLSSTFLPFHCKPNNLYSSLQLSFITQLLTWTQIL